MSTNNQQELDHQHTDVDALRRTLNRMVTELQAILLMSQGRMHELQQPGLDHAGAHHEATLFDLQQRVAQVVQHVAALDPSQVAT